MKVLIGYDGSEPANAAISDLDRAGLPPQTQVTVLSVASVWPGLPISTYETAEAPMAVTPSHVAARAYELARQAMADAREISARAVERIRSAHADWKVQAAVAAGSPAEALVEEAEKWKADLILVGSHGRGALRRLILGSVSHSIISHATCSVRVGRASGKLAAVALRIVVGVDGSAHSAQAVRAVAQRTWPQGTVVHVVTAMDMAISTTIPTIMATQGGLPSIVEDERGWMRKLVDAAADELREAGLEAAPRVLDGDPKSVLIDEAEQWGADCIFVGAKGHGRLERFLIGSVSAAVAARAGCSVEIVRATVP
jgi:nucleotide-binding universal stress UspA family protein